MPTIKVRVNPDDHNEYAIRMDPDGDFDWWIPGGGWRAGGGRINRWPEFYIDVPKPARKFKPGDAVRGTSTGVTFVRTVAVHHWVSMSTEALPPAHDADAADEGAYTYLGNVNELQAS